MCKCSPSFLMTKRLKNLFLLPTCKTKFYQYVGDWKKIYSEDFMADKKSENHQFPKAGARIIGIQGRKGVGRGN